MFCLSHFLLACAWSRAPIKRLRMRRARILSRSPSSRFCRSQPTRQAVFHLKRTAKIKTSRNVDSFSRSPSRRKSGTLFTCGFSKRKWPSTQREQIKAYISQSFAKPPSHVRRNIPKPPTLTHAKRPCKKRRTAEYPTCESTLVAVLTI